MCIIDLLVSDNYLLLSTHLCQSPSVNTHHPTGPQHSQPQCHLDTVLDHIELTTTHLVPLNGHLCHFNPGTSADNTAVAAEDGGGGCRLGEHEHLNVEDPAFGVHVGHDVGEGCAREELEAALGVADARGCGGCEDCEDEVEGSHEEVSQGRALEMLEWLNE